MTLFSPAQPKREGSNTLVMMHFRFAQHPIWELAFRSFFLAGSAFSIVAMITWLVFLNGDALFLHQHKIAPVIWHFHEMIFGFAALCAMGFLLTAVQTWTGLRSAHGWRLIGLLSIWLLARICFWMDAIVWTMAFQGLWWLGSIAIYMHLVLKSSNRRNYQFIPLLLCLMLLNLSVLALANRGEYQLSLHLGRCATLLFTLLVTIVGGRIIPLFTRKAVRSARIHTYPWLEKSVLLATVCAIGLYAFAPQSAATSWVLLVAGSLHLVRLRGWDSFATLNNPLLWSLHLTYFFLILGTLLLGISLQGDWLPSLTPGDALHLIAIGMMGGMILAVISRVALGHTGRPLRLPRPMSIAMLLLPLAALFRSLFSSLGHHHAFWLLSGILWIIAFGLFLLHYLPILWAPRVDKGANR